MARLWGIGNIPLKRCHEISKNALVSRLERVYVCSAKSGQFVLGKESVENELVIDADIVLRGGEGVKVHNFCRFAFEEVLNLCET